MSKPTELNDETMKLAAYYCRAELHSASSSLEMPAYPIGYGDDDDTPTDKYMTDLFHYAQHAQDHILQAITFANAAERNATYTRDKIAKALFKFDTNGDAAAFRAAIAAVLN